MTHWWMKTWFPIELERHISSNSELLYVCVRERDERERKKEREREREREGKREIKR